MAVPRDLAGVMTRKGMFGLLAGAKREAVKHPRGVGAQTSSDLFAIRRLECRNRLRLNVEIRQDYVENSDILLPEVLLRSRGKIRGDYVRILMILVWEPFPDTQVGAGRTW